MSSRFLRVRRPDMRPDRPCAFFVAVSRNDECAILSFVCMCSCMWFSWCGRKQPLVARVVAVRCLT